MKRNLIFVALAVALAASFSGVAKSAKKQAKEAKINFKTEKNGSLECINPLPCDLVLFAGKIERNVVLGGIKGGETRLFDLSKISDMPKQGAFIMRAVPYEVYASEERATIEDVVYTRLVVYDLNDKEGIKIVIPNFVDVSKKFGFYADNDSPFVVELHEDMPDGEVVATLAPYEMNKRISMNPRDDEFAYNFYPTWVYVNPRTNEKTTMIGKRGDIMRAYPTSIEREILTLRFEGPYIPNIGYDAAFITLKNETRSGISFLIGATTLKNTEGIQFTAAGRSDVYELAFENGDSEQTYTQLNVKFDNSSTIKIAPTTFMPGYKYELVITDMNGNYEYDIHEVGKKSIVEDARIQLLME